MITFLLNHLLFFLLLYKVQHFKHEDYSSPMLHTVYPTMLPLLFYIYSTTNCIYTVISQFSVSDR
eukprot:UN07236